jgi:hypothetical protein
LAAPAQRCAYVRHAIRSGAFRTLISGVSSRSFPITRFRTGGEGRAISGNRGLAAIRTMAQRL